ncbi:unnamed protein product [Symbiodinium sp. CCMP2592]|nr:unnamed protein product [Symbiodinium sp. CCMP2592]
MGAGPIRGKEEPVEGTWFGKACCSAPGEVLVGRVTERAETIRTSEEEEKAAELAAGLQSRKELEELEALGMEAGINVRADEEIDDQDFERKPSIAAMVPAIDCLPSRAESSRVSARSSTFDIIKSTVTGRKSSAFMFSAESMSKEERLDSSRYSVVDAEIIRGIPLRRSLRGIGRIWRYQPATWKPEERAELYDLSQKVLYFNVFLSHTWHTPGWQKILALSFQCGWRSTLALWCVVETASMAVCMADVLPMPFVFRDTVTGSTECPMGLWVFFFGALALLLGLLFTPYLPSVCNSSDMGFIDVASIHQQDRALMERGVYGIAGFLRVSSELRILWSAPYLSRLWCIFELAAYRKVNPDGIIRFRPLFVERTALVLLVSCLSFGAYVPGMSGSEVSLYLAYASLALFNLITAALLRSNYREKHQLRRELQEFDLKQVSCREEFDRKFIHAAISKWYGSQDAFTEFVRQDLRQHLEPCLATRFPMRYLLLLCAAQMSVSLEFVLALWKGGAEPNSILSYVIAMLLGVDVFVLAGVVISINYLSDRFAARRFGCFDHVQITMLSGVIFYAGSSLAEEAYGNSMEHCILFAAVSGVVAFCLYWLDKKAPMPDVSAPTQ